MKTQQDILNNVNDDFESKLNQKYVNMKHAMKVFKAEVSVRLEKKEGDYTNIIKEVTDQSNEIFETIKTDTEKLENSIKFRVSDCETLLRSRVTEDYVKNLG